MTTVWKIVWVDQHEATFETCGDEGQQRGAVLRHLAELGVDPKQLTACYQHTVTTD